MVTKKAISYPDEEIKNDLNSKSLDLKLISIDFKRLLAKTKKIPEGYLKDNLIYQYNKLSELYPENKDNIKNVIIPYINSTFENVYSVNEEEIKKRLQPIRVESIGKFGLNISVDEQNEYINDLYHILNHTIETENLNKLFLDPDNNTKRNELMGVIKFLKTYKKDEYNDLRDKIIDYNINLTPEQLNVNKDYLKLKDKFNKLIKNTYVGFYKRDLDTSPFDIFRFSDRVERVAPEQVNYLMNFSAREILKSEITKSLNEIKEDGKHMFYAYQIRNFFTGIPDEDLKLKANILRNDFATMSNSTIDQLGDLLDKTESIKTDLGIGKIKYFVADFVLDFAIIEAIIAGITKTAYMLGAETEGSTLILGGLGSLAGFGLRTVAKIAAKEKEYQRFLTMLREAARSARVPNALSKAANLMGKGEEFAALTEKLTASKFYDEFIRTMTFAGKLSKNASRTSALYTEMATKLSPKGMFFRDAFIGAAYKMLEGVSKDDVNATEIIGTAAMFGAFGMAFGSLFTKGLLRRRVGKEVKFFTQEFFNNLNEKLLEAAESGKEVHFSEIFDIAAETAKNVRDTLIRDLGEKNVNKYYKDFIELYDETIADVSDQFKRLTEKGHFELSPEEAENFAANIENEFNELIGRFNVSLNKAKNSITKLKKLDNARVIELVSLIKEKNAFEFALRHFSPYTGIEKSPLDEIVNNIENILEKYAPEEYKKLKTLSEAYTKTAIEGAIERINIYTKEFYEEIPEVKIVANKLGENAEKLSEEMRMKLGKNIFLDAKILESFFDTAIKNGQILSDKSINKITNVISKLKSMGFEKTAESIEKRVGTYAEEIDNIKAERLKKLSDYVEGIKAESPEEEGIINKIRSAINEAEEELGSEAKTKRTELVTSDLSNVAASYEPSEIRKVLFYNNSFTVPINSYLTEVLNDNTSRVNAVFNALFPNQKRTIADIKNAFKIIININSLLKKDLKINDSEHKLLKDFIKRLNDNIEDEANKIDLKLFKRDKDGIIKSIKDKAKEYPHINFNRLTNKFKNDIKKFVDIKLSENLMQSLNKDGNLTISGLIKFLKTSLDEFSIVADESLISSYISKKLRNAILTFNKDDYVEMFKSRAISELKNENVYAFSEGIEGKATYEYKHPDILKAIERFFNKIGFNTATFNYGEEIIEFQIPELFKNNIMKINDKFYYKDAMNLEANILIEIFSGIKNGSMKSTDVETLINKLVSLQEEFQNAETNTNRIYSLLADQLNKFNIKANEDIVELINKNIGQSAEKLNSTGETVERQITTKLQYSGESGTSKIVVAEEMVEKPVEEQVLKSAANKYTNNSLLSIFENAFTEDKFPFIIEEDLVDIQNIILGKEKGYKGIINIADKNILFLEDFSDKTVFSNLDNLEKNYIEKLFSNKKEDKIYALLIPDFNNAKGYRILILNKNNEIKSLLKLTDEELIEHFGSVEALEGKINDVDKLVKSSAEKSINGIDKELYNLTYGTGEKIEKASKLYNIPVVFIDPVGENKLYRLLNRLLNPRVELEGLNSLSKFDVNEKTVLDSLYKNFFKEFNEALVKNEGSNNYLSLAEKIISRYKNKDKFITYLIDKHFKPFIESSKYFKFFSDIKDKKILAALYKAALYEEVKDYFLHNNINSYVIVKDNFSLVDNLRAFLNFMPKKNPYSLTELDKATFIENVNTYFKNLYRYDKDLVEQNVKITEYLFDIVKDNGIKNSTNFINKVVDDFYLGSLDTLNKLKIESKEDFIESIKEYRNILGNNFADNFIKTLGEKNIKSVNQLLNIPKTLFFTNHNIETSNLNFIKTSYTNIANNLIKSFSREEEQLSKFIDYFEKKFSKIEVNLSKENKENLLKVAKRLGFPDIDIQEFSRDTRGFISKIKERLSNIRLFRKIIGGDLPEGSINALSNTIGEDSKFTKFMRKMGDAYYNVSKQFMNLGLLVERIPDGAIKNIARDLVNDFIEIVAAANRVKDVIVHGNLYAELKRLTPEENNLLSKLLFKEQKEIANKTYTKEGKLFYKVDKEILIEHLEGIAREILGDHYEKLNPIRQKIYNATKKAADELVGISRNKEQIIEHLSQSPYYQLGRFFPLSRSGDYTFTVFEITKSVPKAIEKIKGKEGAKNFVFEMLNKQQTGFKKLYHARFNTTQELEENMNKLLNNDKELYDVYDLENTIDSDKLKKAKIVTDMPNPYSGISKIFLENKGENALKDGDYIIVATEKPDKILTAYGKRGLSDRAKDALLKRLSKYGFNEAFRKQIVEELSVDLGVESIFNFLKHRKFKAGYITNLKENLLHYLNNMSISLKLDNKNKLIEDYLMKYGNGTEFTFPNPATSKTVSISDLNKLHNIVERINSSIKPDNVVALMTNRYLSYLALGGRFSHLLVQLFHIPQIIIGEQIGTGSLLSTALTFFGRHNDALRQEFVDWATKTLESEGFIKDFLSNYMNDYKLLNMPKNMTNKVLNKIDDDNILSYIFGLKSISVGDRLNKKIIAQIFANDIFSNIIKQNKNLLKNPDALNNIKELALRDLRLKMVQYAFTGIKEFRPNMLANSWGETLLFLQHFNINAMGWALQNAEKIISGLRKGTINKRALTALGTTYLWSIFLGGQQGTSLGVLGVEPQFRDYYEKFVEKFDLKDDINDYYDSIGDMLEFGVPAGLAGIDLSYQANMFDTFNFLNNKSLFDSTFLTSYLHNLGRTTSTIMDRGNATTDSQINNVLDLLSSSRLPMINKVADFAKVYHNDWQIRNAKGEPIGQVNDVKDRFFYGLYSALGFIPAAKSTTRNIKWKSYTEYKELNRQKANINKQIADIYFSLLNKKVTKKEFNNRMVDIADMVSDYNRYVLTLTDEKLKRFNKYALRKRYTANRIRQSLLWTQDRQTKNILNRIKNYYYDLEPEE